MASDWQRALIALTATVITVVVVALMYWARSIFIPITMAIFLAFVLMPVVTRLQRRGLGRVGAVLATVGMVSVVAFGIGALITQQISQLANTLPDRRDAIKAKVAEAKSWLVGDGTSRFGQLVDEVTDIISPPKPKEQPTVVAEAPGPSVATRLEALASPAAEVLGQAAFTFILTIFMLLKREDLRNRMIRLLGAGRVTTTTKAVDDASQRISRFLFTQLMLNLAFGVVIIIGLFLMGVKYALLWGVIASLMRYVPYIGTWLGLIPAVLFSFATAEGLAQPIGVLVLFIGLEMLCNNIFEPLLYGKSMGLSEVAQLVAAGFWTFLWGPIGLVLSGPLTVCLLVLGRHVREFEFFVILLGDQPALNPNVAFYQRLAARDQDEASDVALEVAERESPTASFETILIPALYLARQDHEAGNIDAADMRFIVETTREIAAELVELREPTNSDMDARVRILLSPARDEAEQVAAEIFAQTLSPSRWEAKVAEDGTLASELMGQIGEFQPSVVVIAAMPPGGVSHARYLVTRIRQRFPEIKILVGRWGGDAELDARSESIKNTDGVDHTFAGTHKRLSELHALLGNEQLTATAAK